MEHAVVCKSSDSGDAPYFYAIPLSILDEAEHEFILKCPAEVYDYNDDGNFETLNNMVLRRKLDFLGFSDLDGKKIVRCICVEYRCERRDMAYL